MTVCLCVLHSMERKLCADIFFSFFQLQHLTWYRTQSTAKINAGRLEGGGTIDQSIIHTFKYLVRWFATPYKWLYSNYQNVHVVLWMRLLYGDASEKRAPIRTTCVFLHIHESPHPFVRFYLGYDCLHQLFAGYNFHKQEWKKTFTAFGCRAAMRSAGGAIDASVLWLFHHSILDLSTFIHTKLMV